MYFKRYYVDEKLAFFIGLFLEKNKWNIVSNIPKEVFEYNSKNYINNIDRASMFDKTPNQHLDDLAAILKRDKITNTFYFHQTLLINNGKNIMQETLDELMILIKKH